MEGLERRQGREMFSQLKFSKIKKNLEIPKSYIYEVQESYRKMKQWKKEEEKSYEVSNGLELCGREMIAFVIAQIIICVPISFSKCISLDKSEQLHNWGHKVRSTATIHSGDVLFSSFFFLETILPTFNLIVFELHA